jgi:hypothetical protein
VIYVVNQNGSLCLAAGAVFGFAGAGLGYLVGPYLGMGDAGYLIGIAVGGIVIILVDFAVRVRAYFNYECGVIGAFLWPTNGGTVNGCHAAFDGLLFLALGMWAISASFKLQTQREEDEARKIAGKKEADHLARITQRLSRDGIDIRTSPDKKGVYTIALTNKTGKDFAKVRIVTRSRYFGDALSQTLTWPEWKNGEAKTFTDPGRGEMTEFGIDMEGYPPGAEEPRFIIISHGRVKGGKWERNEIGS